MDLRQLEVLVAVADAGGVTAAAHLLGLGQPAVSGSLRSLERSLGERLVEREGRGVRLTDAGRAALGPARDVLRAAGEVRTAVARLSGLLGGELRLGHVGSGATGTVLPPLAAFHDAHPGVAVSLVEDTSQRLLERLADGTLDLAWVATAGALPAGTEARTVAEDDVVVAVPAGHPWAGRVAVPLADVAAASLVVMPAGTGSRAALEQACAARGLVPRVSLEVSAPDLLARLVEAGLGAGVLAAPLAEALGLVPVRVRPALRSRLVLAWRVGGPSSPAARAFLAEVGRAR